MDVPRSIDIEPFDSRWVPPVGGAPSRHTGTGGATDGVHAQCLRDSGAGDRSRVVPRAAARRSRVVPRSKQLGSQTRRCRAEQAAGQGSNKPTSHERDPERGLVGLFPSANKPTSGENRVARQVTSHIYQVLRDQTDQVPILDIVSRRHHTIAANVVPTLGTHEVVD